MRVIHLVLVLTLVFGAPAHCLAEALDSPKLPQSFADPLKVPQVAPLMHCCHPEGVLSSAPRIFLAAALSDLFAHQSLIGQGPVSLEILPLNHGPPKGPLAPVVRAFSSDAFPLLI